MSAYKLLTHGMVFRFSDKAQIPPSTDNMDWVRYQEWLALGNTPQPADPLPPISAPKDMLDWFKDLSPARKTLFKDEMKKP